MTKGMIRKVGKKRIIYTLLVTLIVVFSSTYAILMTLERMDYRNYLLAQYSKNMYELINAVENIEDNLSKSAVTGTKEENNLIFQEIFRHAAKANDSLNSLPITQNITNETSKFLSQVGDYSYTLVRNSSEGKELSDQDYSLLDRLDEQSFELKEQLNSVLADINQGRVKWGEIRKKASGVLAKEDESLVSNKFVNIQKQVTQYPALIYDGPFSDNIIEIKPKVNELQEVTKEEAANIVRKVIGNDKVENIEQRDSQGTRPIEVYSFNITMKGRKKDENVVCEVSKKGGKILYILDNKNLSKPNLNIEKAVEAGTKFLNDIGYKSMASTYILKYEDSIVVSFVYNIGNIIIYPDQIKLKIALDDGSIIGMESQKYLVTHVENRVLPEVKITEEEGRKKVGKRLQISSVKLAVIPTETNNEVLCYEYTGTYKDNSFIVYINAQSGEPQKIIKIINTPNGQLTI